MFKAVSLVDIKAGPDDGLGEGTFTGYASVFDVKDSYGDVVRPGAFTDTLSEWKSSGNALPLLYGHDMTDPFSNIGTVTAAEEDERGLKVTCQLDLDDTKAEKVYRLLKGRRLSQMSFAYDILDGKPAKSEDFGDYFELTRLKLYEVSVVPIGANQETEILAVKHRLTPAKAGRTLSAKNESALVDALAAIDAGRAAIDSVLASLAEDGKSARSGGTTHQDEASGEPKAKTDASAEEPPGAKATVSAEEPKAGPSVDTLAAEIELLALT